MWSRFAAPIEVLRTYTLLEAIDFILYLLEKQQEDLAWDTWLQLKPTDEAGNGIPYAAYKKSMRLPNLRDKGIELINAEQEKKQIEFASQFIKPKETKEDGTRR